MKALIIRLILFSVPFLIAIAIEWYIDPFNYFGEERNYKLLKIKENTARKVNPYLYKFIKYKRNPHSTIVLGDSRINRLDESIFRQYGYPNVSNLAMGGGTLQDAINIFWYTSRIEKLTKVFIGISLETYSGTFLRDRVTPSLQIINSPITYLLNRYTFESTLYILKSLWTNKNINLYVPSTSKEVFWQNQLDWSARYLKNYSYPANYYRELKAISIYCTRHHIKLVFILSPTHIDLQKKIHDFGLDDDFEKLKSDLSTLGDVYDFNYPNAITNDVNNFSDPYHHNDSISKIIVKELLTGNTSYSKKFRKLPAQE